MLKLYKNSAQCLKCNDIITSTYVHDFRSCSCGSVSVDGGNYYIRRSFKDYKFVKDLVEYVDTETGEIIDSKEYVKRPPWTGE